MSDAPANPFLDVPMLLEASIPRPRGGWFWYAGGVFLLIVLLSTYIERGVANGRQIVNFLSSLIMLALIGAMGYMTWRSARQVQGEQLKLAAVEELVQMRRWPEAAWMLQEMLTRPTRTPQGRLGGLVFLSSVLARYHRFHDAIVVYDHLLEHENLDGGTIFGLKLARAMALLREDRLFDADRAIAELRRMQGSERSGGLALVEIYRDIKTGHPREAIELFAERRNVMRDQLGMRLADALALVARGHDLMNESSLAAINWDQATLLVPEPELVRRYPELAVMIGRYAPAIVPKEAA